MAKRRCDRCGYEWESKNARRAPTLCSSCRAIPVQTVHSIFGKCVPWQGRYAEDLVTPIDGNGDPVLPGVRKCRHFDCVNPKHINLERKHNG